MKLALTVAVLAAGALRAQIGELSGERMRAHVRFLASDLLEGRGVGTRGGDLATEYIAAQFALAGAKPAGDQGTYFQNFTLAGTEPQSTTQLSAVTSSGAAAAAGKTIAFRWLDDFVGVTLQQKSDVSFEAEAIFVGHGITAPEYQWDDYKGVDVRGKVVVLFTGEPPSNDPKFFAGPALTYYGRWTYKYEEAARHGALGAIIIHTTPTASYGWNVVRSSWSKEDVAVKVAPGAQALAFAGWVTQEAGGQIAAVLGKKTDDLLRTADLRGFKAMPIPVRFHLHALSKVREISTRNVIAKVEGSDPRLKDEAVIFSAHWDHLGIGEPQNGDRIYNGAVDNATGCGILLEMARAWASLPEKPRRSALFISVSAEEAGLLGSEYYAQHPAVPPGKTAVAINYDAFLPLGRYNDFGAYGAERTTVYPLVQEAAKRLGLAISPDPRPLAGLYYRSDHFMFARVGIPAFSIDRGDDLSGRAPGTGAKLFEEFNTQHYHQPSDEYHDDWDFSGLELYARLGFLIGMDAANISTLPTWKAGDEFLPARIASGVK
jgi:Zn-dependent M28 family amino/carboxypeptidase